MNITELRSLLSTDIVDVVFTKKNGERREMTCTLIADYLPEVNGRSVTNDEVVTVWDMEKQAWRSFRFDSIQSVDTEYANYVMDKCT